VKRWEPMSAGMHYLGDDEVGFIVSLDGSLLTMYPITGDEEFDNEAGRSIQLDPNKYRLCHLVDAEDSAQPPVPVPNAATLKEIRKFLEGQHYIASCVDDAVSPDMRRYAAALKWIDSHAKGDSDGK
jgi:hypothetical protein